ncbi:MAG: GXGXG motif-containing protein [Acidimicrobiales bacterium]
MTTGERRIRYDARGLAEPDAEAPRTSEIKDGHAFFDAAECSIRQINLELRWLLGEKGIRDVVVRNPGAKHSLGVGILQRCKICFEGSLGYFGLGLIDGPEVQVTGRVGWSVAENMMAGVVVVEHNSGSLTGAAMRGGDLVVKGDVGARTGIDQKGGTIIVGGRAGLLTGFMMQRGRQIICGDAGAGLGDSMYDGAIFVGGKVASLGVDCEEAEVSPADEAMIGSRLSYYEMENPGGFRKFVCARKLWNYDALEPSERKLVL